MSQVVEPHTDLLWLAVEVPELRTCFIMFKKRWFLFAEECVSDLI